MAPPHIRYIHSHSLYTQLTSELKQIEAARAAQEPMVRRLEAETEQLSAQIAALNKEQALLQAQVRTLKQTGTELSDKVRDTCHLPIGLSEKWNLKQMTWNIEPNNL